MLNSLLTSVFGSRNERLLKQLSGIVRKINALEPDLQTLSDEALKAKTDEFKARVAGGESLDKLLPEAFAVCREASVRVFGMRHFDVQLIGGMVLHSGKIAEMRTGEGKTLMATCRCIERAGRQGRHVITVNDTWPAATPAGWASCTPSWAGVGVVYPGMPHATRGRPTLRHHLRHQQRIRLRYLRDNMALAKEDRFHAAALRHHRRGRLDPDRRGAHPADHLRSPTIPRP